MTMTATITALDKWYGYMKSHDSAALWDLLHYGVRYDYRVLCYVQLGY